MDLKNKEVIGYEVSKNIDSELCKKALANSLALRVRHKNWFSIMTEEVSTVAEHTKVCWQKTALRDSLARRDARMTILAWKAFWLRSKRELIFRRKYAAIENVVKAQP